MNTKDIGNLGEHLAIVELLKRDVKVSRPLGDNSRYDLILDIKGLLLTCQVKSTNCATKERAEFSLSSSQAHRGGTRHKYEVDVFCLVDILNNTVMLYSNINDQYRVTIRYTDLVAHNTNVYSDYTIDKYIDDI